MVINRPYIRELKRRGEYNEIIKYIFFRRHGD